MGARFPTFLRIGGHKFTVELLDEEAAKKRLPDAFAQVDTELNEILITAKAAPSRRIVALLHEVVHALLVGLDLSGKKEETIAVVLGEGLARVLLGNKNLLNYLRAHSGDSDG